MSVVVLGMEMPESCLRCILFAGNGCKGSGKIFPDWLNVAIRPTGCPLRPLPKEHGRLIDDSQLRETFGMGERCDECKQDKRDCQYNQIFTRMDFCGWLDDMETIVEAEGE